VLDLRSTGQESPSTSGESAAQQSGILPGQTIRGLVRDGHIRSALTIEPDQIQPASLDLRLGEKAYRLRCSFLPGEATVSEKVNEYSMEVLDLRDGAVLERNRPYLIRLAETLSLPPTVRARANPRSSTGRLDIFTRVVTDHGLHFDDVQEGYSGPLWLEVVSRSFTVKVRTGMALNQLRFVMGDAECSDDDLRALHHSDPILFTKRLSADAKFGGGVFLSIDLSRREFVGYRARKNSALLELDRIHYYQPRDFWERLPPDRGGRLVLEPEEFYLLVSLERIRIPSSYAAEMAAYDPTSGELRTHYAGFFDPGFGCVDPELPQGTHAVMEVRAHDVPFALEHGQRVCKLTFERMQVEPETIYGQGIGSRYQRQYLALGKQFVEDDSAFISDRAEQVLFPDEPLTAHEHASKRTAGADGRSARGAPTRRV
jgi:dCTP deaminase